MVDVPPDHLIDHEPTVTPRDTWWSDAPGSLGCVVANTRLLVFPLMEHSQLLAREIRAECARQKVSGRELARRLGEHHMWSHRRLAGEQEITVDDLYRIADALNMQPTDLLLAAA